MKRFYTWALALCVVAIAIWGFVSLVQWRTHSELHVITVTNAGISKSGSVLIHTFEGEEQIGPNISVHWSVACDDYINGTECSLIEVGDKIAFDYELYDHTARNVHRVS